MHYSTDIFGHQYVVVMDFLQHLTFYRSIKSELERQGANSNFWVRTCNAHLEAAILDWCKVFGSEGPNPTHWKKTAGQTPDAAQNEFRDVVFRRTGFKKPTWDDYQKNMCAFRDRYIAHLAYDKIPPLPVLDNALQVTFAYDEWIRKQIEPDIIDGPSLEHLYSKWLVEAKKLIRIAIQHHELNV